MKLRLISISKSENEAIEKIFNDYEKRLSHYISLEPVHIKPLKAKNEVEQRKSDSDLILKKAVNEDFMVLLDGRGRQFSSEEFATWLSGKMNERAKSLCFVIGGAFGVDDRIYSRSNEKISLSKFTLPHQLAKIIFAEQLYRAFTILKNEKYHH